MDAILHMKEYSDVVSRWEPTLEEVWLPKYRVDSVNVISMEGRTRSSEKVQDYYFIFTFPVGKEIPKAVETFKRTIEENERLLFFIECMEGTGYLFEGYCCKHEFNTEENEYEISVTNGGGKVWEIVDGLKKLEEMSNRDIIDHFSGYQLIEKLIQRQNKLEEEEKRKMKKKIDGLFERIDQITRQYLDKEGEK
jgi:hypothetical protein